ncbi:adenylosuccinate synthase [SAR86 cluster bacterium]|nr:adenylosuccinate synthase [SAR86 cluster bacterium]
MKAKNLAVLGLQWGDEGKGKIVNFLSDRADAACRYQGGHNAGHTLIVDGKKLVLHLLPSSICHENASSLIGRGVVVSCDALFAEIDEIEPYAKGIMDRLKISPACTLIQPYHILLDQLKEKSNSFTTIGTTLRGIGPAYEDKVSRKAIRIVDTLSESKLDKKLEETLSYYNFLFKEYFGVKELEFSEIKDKNLEYGNKLLPLLSDISNEIFTINQAKKRVLFEGAQGALLDVDQGTYPFVTSSNCSPAGIASGAGCGPLDVGYILGVVKAYVTRVGEGPMPTEIEGNLGEEIARKGGEVGATTGRPRRCGWFDAVSVKRIIQSNSVAALCLTKIDVLDGFESIKICTNYNQDESKKVFAECMELDDVNPNFIECEGWSEPTAGINDYDLIPENAKKFINKIEEICGIPVDIISTGPDDASTILMNKEI